MALTLFALGAVLTPLTLAILQRRLPTRQNYARRRIPTATGLCLTPIILLTLVVQAAGYVPREGFVFSLYLLLAVAAGFVDDVWGDEEDRGFGGHVGALLGGKVTTGMVKVVSLGGGALLVGGSLYGVGISGLFAAFLLAGCANLGNLLDIRPGRAIKFVGLPALVLLLFSSGWVGFAVVGVIGGALGLFYFDLGGRIMLGDAGAAVMGSTLGCLVVASGPGPVWWVAGGTVVFLTVVAEYSSISRLIEGVGALRWLDLLGRARDE